MKRLVVLGGGESGYGSAVLGKHKEWEVFLSDYGTIAPKYREQLIAQEIEFEEGGHTLEKIYSADLVVKSPGIAETVPLIVELRQRGVPIVSEIEFAGRYNTAKTICITGANGKTTTAELTYHILRGSGVSVGLGGNIGMSFALQVATENHKWMVVELSSFQLDGMYDFRADIALLTNITPDHLDRYDYSMLKYAESKMRVIQNLRQEDYFVYCRDDKQTMQMVQMPKYNTPAHRLTFGLSGKECTGELGAVGSNEDGGNAWIDEGRINVVVEGRRYSIESDQMLIKGQHNQYNAMSAIMVAMILGVSDEAITAGLTSFRGVEHRLEYVANIGGVDYINDSKATNTDAAWYALEAMSRPVVWIVGGTDKGNDYGELKKLVAERVKAVVFMGTDNQKLIDNFGGVAPATYNTDSMESALTTAREVASEGDVVLLSPACASFDLFKNYMDRGEQFKEWVKRTKKESL